MGQGKAVTLGACSDKELHISTCEMQIKTSMSQASVVVVHSNVAAVVKGCMLQARSDDADNSTYSRS